MAMKALVDASGRVVEAFAAAHLAATDTRGLDVVDWPDGVDPDTHIWRDGAAVLSLPALRRAAKDRIDAGHSQTEADPLATQARFALYLEAKEILILGDVAVTAMSGADRRLRFPAHYAIVDELGWNFAAAVGRVRDDIMPKSAKLFKRFARSLKAEDAVGAAATPEAIAAASQVEWNAP